MKHKVAINGLGRIGRAALKIIREDPGLELTAVNDLVPLENLVYLLRYDSVYGRYEREVRPEGGHLTVGGEKVTFLQEKDPAQLPWKEMEVDLVFECTGVFTEKEDMAKHIQAGAGRVILSAPSKSKEVVTVVHGVSQGEETPAEIVSCASCTTNCIAPVVEVMGRRLGIRKAIMTTVHAYTSSQQIVDGPSKKLRRGRAGAINFVPTSTGAAKATTKVLPAYKGKFDGVAIRAPIAVGSIADMVFLTEKAASAEEINRIFREESQSERYRSILGVTSEPLVSTDIIKDTRASIVDLSMTQVVDGDLVKIMSWYDNEWGYSCQMIREAHAMLG